MRILSAVAVIAFLSLLATSAKGQPVGKGGVTNVSVALVPSIFFEPVEATTSPFQKLPFETVELMVLNTDQAQALGFADASEIKLFFESDGTEPLKNDYLVIVEAWQRFEVRRASGVKSYIEAVELGNGVDLSSATPFSFDPSEKLTTLVKYGVSFRTIFVVEINKEEGAPTKLDEYFNGSRRILARIEIAGSASPGLTKALPGVFKLLTGYDGISAFLRSVTAARQEIWDGFLKDSPDQPNLQVLGWAFRPKRTEPGTVESAGPTQP